MRAFAFHRGSAMAEFTIVALPLLLAGFGAFEAGRWLLARQAAGYALFEAARAGVVAGAEPAAMRAAFARALGPAFAVGQASSPARLASAVTGRIDRWQRRHGLRIARIEQISPSRASFDDFALPGGQRPRVLDHDYQRLKHDTRYQARYHGGVGPRSGQTLFEANTLVLRLTYLHAPYLPGLRALLRRLGGPADDDYARRAREAGLVVIRREIALPMQSAAREHAQAADLLAGLDE